MNYISANLATIGVCHLYKDYYLQAITWLSQALKAQPSPATRAKCNLLLALTYASTAQVDSAQMYLEKSVASTAVDSMRFLRASALIDYARRDIEEFQKHDDAADSIAHCLLVASSAVDLKEAETNFMLNLHKAEKQKTGLKVLLVALITFSLLLCVVLLLALLKYRTRSERETIAALRESLLSHKSHTIELANMSQRMRESIIKQQTLLQKMALLYDQDLPDETFLPRIKKLLTEYEPEPGFWQDAFQYANLRFSNILDDLKERYPKFTEPYARVLSLACCGCSNTDIMVLTGHRSLGVIRNYKSKITRDILGIDITIRGLIERYRPAAGGNPSEEA